MQPKQFAFTRCWQLGHALTLITGLSGCAHLPEGSRRDPRDHFERFNRAIYKFDTTLDHAVLRPVARGYVKVAPRPVRTGVSNFFGNLAYTRTIGNDLLQWRLTDFGSDVGRFAVNTTVGIGGIFDPATRIGLEKHDRDFGQTMGKWGVPTGSYLVLPLFGPSDVRDAVGLVPDHFLGVESWINNSGVQAGLSVGSVIDRRAQLLSYDHAVDDAFDPYAFVRSAWLQRRDRKVDEDSPQPAPEDLELDPDTATDPN